MQCHTEAAGTGLEMLPGYAISLVEVVGVRQQWVMRTLCRCGTLVRLWLLSASCCCCCCVVYDALSCWQVICEQAVTMLAPGGYLVLEVGVSVVLLVKL